MTIRGDLVSKRYGNVGHKLEQCCKKTFVRSQKNETGHEVPFVVETSKMDKEVLQ